MDFVKKNLIMVISAAVAVLAIVLIIMGIFKVSGVKEELAEAQTQLSTIDDLSRGVSVPLPDGQQKNLIPTEKVVEQIKELSAKSKAQGLKLLERSLKESIGYDAKTGEIKRKLLVDGIFPSPVSDAQPWKFQKQYHTAIQDILKTMKAGAIPNEKDVKDEEESVAQDLGFLMDDMAQTDSRAGAGNTRASRRGQGAQSSFDQTDKLKVWAVVSAARKRSESIKVYCDQSNLDVINEVYTSTGGTPPAVESMWWAQLSLWLQQDMADAVAQANSEAKNVTESVVKRITKVDLMHGYVLKDGFVGSETSQLPESFTGMASGTYYDVVRMSMITVVDARRIPEFIDAMYKQGHYVLYSWSVCDLKEASQSSGTSSSYGNIKADDLYEYGSAPVVQLTTYWETYLLSDFYHWGIVGYDLDKKSNKPVLVMYDGKRQEVESAESRENLKGLMPKTIRDALSGEGQQQQQN
jgi:hypothetical protein